MVNFIIIIQVFNFIIVKTWKNYYLTFNKIWLKYDDEIISESKFLNKQKINAIKASSFISMESQR